MHLTIQRQIPHTQEDELWDVVPVAAGLRDIPPNFFDYFWGGGDKQFNWHEGRTLQNFQIMYITRGCGVYQSHDIGSIDVSAGDLLLVFPDVWHRYCPRKEVGWREYWAMFGGMLPSRLLMHGILNRQSPVLHVGTGVIDDLWEEIADMVQKPEMGPACLIGLKVSLILTTALEAVGLLTDGRRSNESDHERAITNAATFMETQVHAPIDVARLAQSLGMSPRSFRRHFKELRGVTPQDFHVQARVKQAKALLRTSNARINQIAEALGYADVHQFHRMFRKVTGTTPAQYRSELSQDAD